MKNGLVVRAFEEAFAQYVGADHAIAFCNGTVTMHVALRALGVEPGYRVPTTPLTMSATTMAILHAGGMPLYVDVDPHTWVADTPDGISVSLYGAPAGRCRIDDAAQRLGPHNRDAFFTSYSFQASKHISTGEGGMLTTDSEELATLARSLGSLGYDLRADAVTVDSRAIKSPDTVRHVRVGWNYRMNDLTAAEGLRQLAKADAIMADRKRAWDYYAAAVDGCRWITPQAGNVACWVYALAAETPDLALRLQEAVERCGGERPYGAWRLSYQEPGLQGLRAINAPCPVAESLQPRILQFQTNDLGSAERNAEALRQAIREVG